MRLWGGKIKGDGTCAHLYKEFADESTDFFCQLLHGDASSVFIVDSDALRGIVCISRPLKMPP